MSGRLASPSSVTRDVGSPADEQCTLQHLDQCAVVARSTRQEGGGAQRVQGKRQGKVRWCWAGPETGHFNTG